MAVGAVTISEKRGGKTLAPQFMENISFAGEASYPTGGMLGLDASLESAAGESRRILGIVPGDCGGYVPVWVPSTGAVKVYYADNNNAADGPLIEVPATTNLSAVTFQLLVLSA
ncbi:MAG: hypothetical protein HOW73_43185 [Polyangiaceae bacterium]|nr:hypothetical protein [Polyangiaceae bacterium]